MISGTYGLKTVGCTQGSRVGARRSQYCPIMRGLMQKKMEIEIIVCMLSKL